MNDVKSTLKELVSSVKVGDSKRTNVCLESLLADKPTLNVSWLGVAQMAILSGNVSFAKQALEQFHPSEKNSIREKLQQLTMLIETGQIELAFKRANKLVEKTPTSPEINHFLSTVALQLGKPELAIKYAELVLKHWPTSGPAWLVLVSSEKILVDSLLLKRMLSIESLVVGTPNQISKSSFYAALCKAYFDINDFDKAFKYASKANEYLSETQSDSIDEECQNLNYIASRYASFVEGPQHKIKVNANNPIFVVGLPRSGTSLLEQMLCNHSGVIDGGEFNGIERASRCITKGLPIGSRAEQLDEHIVDKYVEEIRCSYLQYTHEKYGESGVVVDKSMSNNSYLWLIKKIFPNSPIIFVKRNILDTAWSCFRTHFSSGFSWSTSLENTAKYFSSEENLNQLWLQKFKSSILTINYEELVTQPEALLKEISVFCGLEYEESMLMFHESKRAVFTASVAQVRDRVYQNAIGYGEKVRPELQPFINNYAYMDN
jgi:tetratricopeptide (TPR) repeat protein